MSKETMVEVKKEVLSELNVKEENIDVIYENEYMEVEEEEEEEDVTMEEAATKDKGGKQAKKNGVISDSDDE